MVIVLKSSYLVEINTEVFTNEILWLRKICLQIIQWGNEESGWEYGWNKTDYKFKTLEW